VSNSNSRVDVLKYKFLSRKDFMYDQSSLNDRLSDSYRHLMVLSFSIVYAFIIPPGGKNNRIWTKWKEELL